MLLLDVHCNSAVQVLVIVRLDHVSVRELNSGAISRSCPGDAGQEETKDTLWRWRRLPVHTQRWKSVSDSETKRISHFTQECAAFFIFFRT